MKTLYGLAVITTIIVAAVLSGCDSPVGPDEPKPKGGSSSPPPATLGNLVVYAYSDESEFDSVRCFVPSYSLDLIEMLYEGDRYTVDIELDSGSYNIIAEGYREGQATCSGFGSGYVSSNQTTTVDISLSYDTYEVVGFCGLSGGNNKVIVDDSYAYVQVCSPWYEPGFEIVDISDPTNPNYVGFFQSTYSIRDIAVAGDYAYVICEGLRVIDISNPTEPAEVGFLEFHMDVCARNIIVEGNYAFVSGYFNYGIMVMYFWVIDISNPTNPVQVGFNQTYGFACYDIDVSDHYAYLACSHNGLSVVDISDPSNPNIIAQCEFTYAAWKISVSGNNIYVAGYSPNIMVGDISMPSNPVQIGCCDYIWYPNDITVSDNFVYAVTDYSLIEVNAADPSNPIITGLCRLPEDTKGVAISGDYAYVACYTSGLQVLYIGE